MKCFLLDPIKFTAVGSKNKKSVSLTAVEYRVLSVFLRFGRKRISVDQISEYLYGNSNSKNFSKMKVYISSLRKKFFKIGLIIVCQKSLYWVEEK